MYLQQQKGGKRGEGLHFQEPVVDITLNVRCIRPDSEHTEKMPF